MKITILTAAALLMAGISTWVISFINGAIYVDYALGVMMAFISIVVVLNTSIVERTKIFTDGFRREISKIEVKKEPEEIQKEEKDILTQAREYIIRSFEIDKSHEEIEKTLIENGLTAEQINFVVNQLITEGVLTIDKGEPESEKPKPKAKKRKKK